MLAHGKAVQAFRASGRPGEIGITNANTSYEPADDTPETAQAVELARDFNSRLFHGGVFGKGYPDSVLKYHEARNCALPIEEGDMEVIAQPTDFLGVNLYSRGLIQASPGRGVGYAYAAPRLPLLPMGYEAAPHSLGDFVKWVSKEYGNPKIYITENGVCDNTEPGSDGQVNDTTRIELLSGFLAGLHSAIEEGCDVRAFYQWSLYDNFEWAFGYTKRFGMVYTDFETQKRIPKASASWYREVIRRNGVEV
jgi:beta-glucosidase